MQGLMSSYPLTLTHVFGRAERLFPEKGIATGQHGLEIVRTTYGEWAERTRRLAGVLDALEISADGRVGTFAWNTARHLELYFAAPCSGRVLHTLNIRLFPDDIVYIADHAEDEVVFVDRSLLTIFWPLIERFETVKHVVVMDDGDGEVPDDPRVHDYEALLADAEPVAQFKIDDENQAAAMCYTSGTTGHPKGVVYSHRSTVLHSMGALVADAAAVSERDTIMPVVPMFHANAWGLCQAAVMAGSSLVLPGPNMQPKALAELMESEKVTLAAGVPTIWMGVLPELEGRDLSVAARHRLRRLGRPALAVGGLPRADRAPDPAGLGDDGDEPGRLDRAHQVDAARPLRGRTGRPARGPGDADPAGGAADRRPGHRRGAARGTARRAASCRRPDRGSRPATTTTTAPRTPSPRTAGCAPATSRRSARTATSGSSTAPRTS